MPAAWAFDKYHRYNRLKVEKSKGKLLLSLYIRTLDFFFFTISNMDCCAIELWALRIVGELLSVSPRIFGSNDILNSLRVLSSGPMLISGWLQFNSRLITACVAQALFITCKRKKGLVNYVFLHKTIQFEVLSRPD